MMVVVTILSFLIIGVLLNIYIILPQKDDISINQYIESTLFLHNANHFEIQQKFECAGYATAYLIRHLGAQAKGSDIYSKLKNKLPFGLILPKSIISFLRKKNYKANYYHGNIETLKSRLRLGIPVIVFIKVFKNKNYYHYLSAIGFDNDKLLFAESLDFLQNDNLYFNRAVELNSFNELWKVKIPFHSYTYIAIEKDS